MGQFDYTHYLQREKTDPLNPDTNDNGILDGDEKVQQTYTQKVDNNVITGISIDGSFSKNINETVSINSIADEDMNCANVVGLVGEPFEIETTSDFNASTITFDIDSTKLNDLNLDDLLLLWYDEENDNFVELNTQVNTEDSTISVYTTHFSKYMIVDKQEWFDCSGSMNGNDPSFIYNQVFQNLWVNSDFDINKYTNYRELAVERYIWAMQSKDKSCIINYSDTATIKCPFASKKSTLISNISISNSGGTNALDAVTKAIEQFNSKDNVNRRIILLCDGDINFDTSESDANGIIALAKQYDIKIYTIGLGSGANSSSLKNLAKNTGGEYFSAITADELYQKYNDIIVEQYQSIDWEDNDNDGIPDHFETQGLMLSNGQIFFTDPTNPDSDGDGLLDGEEIVVTYGQKYIQGAGTNGSSISAVYFSYKSDPNNIDSDGDGINDFDDDLPLVALTEDEQTIKNFFETAELFEIEIVFKGGLIDCWPNILDRIKYVEVLRKCNNSTLEEYHQALYDEGLVISTNINFSIFDGYSTEYNMMSKGIDIDALYQQSWETWSDSLKIATSMWLFGVSDSYCKELAKWDYSKDYKLSLQQEQELKNYVKLSSQPYNNIFSEKSDNHLVNIDGFNKTRQGFKGAHCLQTLEQYSKTKRPINFIGIEKESCIKGVYEIKYQVAKIENNVVKVDQNNNYVWNNTIYYKTVYDTTYSGITTANIQKWAREALTNAKIQWDKHNGCFVHGFASNGLEFEGWINLETGMIESYYPIIS